MAENAMTIQEFARLGGLARAKMMTKAERSAAGKHAVAARERKRRAAKRLAKKAERTNGTR